MVKSVRQLAEFDENEHRYKKGTLAKRVGQSIKKCVSILKAEASKIDGEEQVKIAERCKWSSC